jgi:hypothetical protein
MNEPQPDSVNEIVTRLRQLTSESAHDCTGHEKHKRDEPCKNQCPSCKKRAAEPSHNEIDSH